MNRRGLYTLFRKEVLRFLRVSTQTIGTPVMTALLYLLVFAYVMEGNVHVYDGVGYTVFLVPGLIMMSVIQNAFANASSSIIQSKMNGNVTFMLLAPLSPLEIFIGYVGASVVRGLAVGLGVSIAGLLVVAVLPDHVLWMSVFVLLASGLLGALGLIAGIWADKYEQLAGFQNFIILPLSFLSGVFYSIHSLPPFWQHLSRFNPFFYMIDGFRFGLIGVSDVSPWLSLGIVGGFLIVTAGLCLHLLHTGYKLRN
ncbi:MAG: ABC transporter permease [Gammaproteobacteria bacterium]|nr:ABC transporter permease [Gammaproteobacteria bacterium]